MSKKTKFFENLENLKNFPSKKIIILLSMLVLMLGLNKMVLAGDPTCAIDTPPSNSAINGTYLFNTTITYNSYEGNVTSCNWSTSSNANFCIDSRINGTHYNCTYNTASLTEIKQTTVSAKCYLNGTETSFDCTSSTGVDIDNTNPVCSMRVDREIIRVGDPLEIDCSDSTDTTDITYSVTFCTLDSTTCTAETPTNGIATFEESQTFDLGEGKAGCIVTDEVTKTNSCTNVTINVRGSDGGDDATIIEEKEKREESKKIIVILSVLVIIIIAIITTIFVSMKKKKR